MKSIFFPATLISFCLFFNACKEVSCDPNSTIAPTVSVFILEDSQNNINPDTVNIENLIFSIPNDTNLIINENSNFYLFFSASHSGGVRQIQLTSPIKCLNVTNSLNYYDDVSINATPNSCSAGDKVKQSLTTSIKISGSEVFSFCQNNSFVNLKLVFTAKNYNTSINTSESRGRATITLTK